MSTAAPPPPTPQKKSNAPVIIIIVVVGFFFLLVCMGILAAIAIPNFIRYQQRSQELGVKMEMRNVLTAQEQFYVSDADQDGIDDYAQSLDELEKSGMILPIRSTTHTFELVAADGKSFEEGWAMRATPNSSTDRYFYIDQDGDIRVNGDGPAGPGDPLD